MKKCTHVVLYTLFAISSIIVVVVAFYSAQFWFQKIYHPMRYTVGTVRELNEAHLVLERRDGSEQAVILDRDTSIRKGRQVLEGSLRRRDRVLIVGEYDDQGQMRARLIRMLDPNHTNR